METDSLRLLRQRRADLWSRLEESRARVKSHEAEIHQIDAGIAAMERDDIIAPTGNDASLRAVAHHARMANPEAQALTMKQLVLKALEEHLKTGATAQELLEYFTLKWGRNDITRTSLSPQLSRLKSEGKIALVGKVWMTRKEFDEQYEAVLAEASANLFDNENGEAEASPDARTAATVHDHEPSSGELLTRDGSVPRDTKETSCLSE